MFIYINVIRLSTINVWIYMYTYTCIHISPIAPRKHHPATLQLRQNSRTHRQDTYNIYMHIYIYNIHISILKVYIYMYTYKCIHIYVYIYMICIHIYVYIDNLSHLVRIAPPPTSFVKIVVPIGRFRRGVSGSDLQRRRSVRGSRARI